jgi:hypothetical protein
VHGRDGATAFAGGAQTATGAAKAGFTYGALTPQNDHIWFRLRRDRKVIVSHEVEWVRPRQPMHQRATWYSFTKLGSEHGRPMPVKKGTFTKTAVDRYPWKDQAIIEQFRIDGSITPDAITGRITVNVTAKLPDGSGYTCALGPLRYRAVN